MSKENTETLCPACNAVFKSPKLLQCMHTLCENCIVSLDLENVICCPLCSHQTLKKNGISELVPNIIIGSESTQVMNQELAVTSTCSQCDNLALCFCCECFTNMCESCAIIHNKSDGVLKHQICNIERTSLTQILEERQKMCSEHNELMVLFCNQCERFICQNCKLSRKHSEHTFNLVDEMVFERKEKLKHLVEEAKKKKKTIESITVDAETALELIKITNQKNIAYVDENFQLIYETLNTQRLNIIKIINDKYTESVNSINQAKEHNKVLSHCINFTNDVIESNYKTEVIDIFENLKKQLQDISSLTLKLKRTSPSQSSCQSPSQSSCVQDLRNHLDKAENKEQKEIKKKSEKENRSSYHGIQIEPSEKTRHRLLSAPAISFSKKKDKEHKNVGENSARNSKKKIRISLIKSFGSSKNKSGSEISDAKQMPEEKNSMNFEKTPPPRPPPAKSSLFFKQFNETPPPRPINPPHKAVSCSKPPAKPPAPKCLTSMETNKKKYKNSQHEVLTSSPSPSYSENSQIENTFLVEAPIIKSNDDSQNENLGSPVKHEQFNFDQKLSEKVDGHAPDNNKSVTNQELTKSNDCCHFDENIESLYAKVNKRRQSNEEQKTHLSIKNENKENDFSSNTMDNPTEIVNYITNNSEIVLNHEHTKLDDCFLSESNENSLYAKINEVSDSNEKQSQKHLDGKRIETENNYSNPKETCKSASVAFDKPTPSNKFPPEKPQRPRYVAGIELKQIELVLNDEVLNSVIKYLNQACAVIMQNQASENTSHIFSLKDDVICM
ncbi:protein PML isoform X3 [Hydra vulgaris]|uniref:Protein PML isoform X3 n=1 Tax=Hydra vulgaris TaxID=6087 RepID=A0ABM4CQ49_HYDVU